MRNGRVAGDYPEGSTVVCYPNHDPYVLVQQLERNNDGEPVGVVLFPPGGQVRPSGPLPINPGLVYRGVGSTQHWNKGGTAILQTDPAVPVFDVAQPMGFELFDYHHGFQLENLTVFGHEQATAPLLRMQLGGIGTSFKNVRFRDTAHVGVELYGVLNQMTWHDVSFEDCGGGAVVWDMGGRFHGNWLWLVGQIDRCGTRPVRIVDNSARPTVKMRHAELAHVKFEFGNMADPVGVTYTNPGQGEPLVLRLKASWAQNFGGTGGYLLDPADPLYGRLEDCGVGAGMADLFNPLLLANLLQ